MDKDDAGIRIDRAKRVESKDVVGTFEHPASGDTRLMLKMLQETLVKPIGVEVSGFVKPAAIARNLVGRIEAQAGKDMCRDL